MTASEDQTHGHGQTNSNAQHLQQLARKEEKKEPSIT
jgi:hypothetical protein